MKTRNHLKKYKLRSLRTFMLVMLTGFLALSNQGCSKNKGGGGGGAAAVATGAYPYPVGSCVGCTPGSTGVITQAFGQAYAANGPVIDMAVQFYGQNASAGYTGYSYGAYGYNGPVGASGTLVVRYVDAPSTCPIPVGQYQLQLVSYGTMSGESIYNVQLRAIGNNGHQLVVNLANVALFASATNTNGYPYRLTNDVAIYPVSGQCMPGMEWREFL